MEDEIKFKAGTPIGLKIRKVRILHGWSQDELAKKIGSSKSAVSRLENSQEIEPDVLKDICDKLEVTVEGLKNLDEDAALHFTANFYEGSTVHTSAVMSNTATLNNHPIDAMMKYFEKQLEKVRRDFQNELKKNSGK